MVTTDPKLIETALTRGVDEVIGMETLKKKMLEGEKVKIYLGIDPTSPNIHIGNMVPVLKLRDFMELGHEVIFLVGNFTALIGDTSDKEAARPALTPDEIETNLRTYKEQAGKVLDFSKVKITRNGDWLSKLTFEDIIKLAMEFTLKPFIDRDLIARRLREEKPIGLHEVLYPIMQSYDAYYMDADVQVGGVDQRFNMLAGRTLQKSRRDKEMAIITNPLIPGTDGRKMSKSWGNVINVNDLPQDKYGKTMSVSDDLIVPFFKFATRVPLEKVEEIERGLDSKSVEPMEAKKLLAFELTKFYEGKAAAESAAEHFERVVQKKQLPKDIETIEVKESLINIVDLVARSKLAPSKAEARRLVKSGGVYINQNPITDVTAKIEIKNDTILQVGKRRFVKLNSKSSPVRL